MPPAPSSPGPFIVRIIDLSADEDDNVVEEIGPFETVEDASLFAYRYVRDSVERCRAPGMTGDQVLEAWQSFGEDAVVPEGGDEAWHSAQDLAAFAGTRAKSADRDWRSLDPRLDTADEDDE